MFILRPYPGDNYPIERWLQEEFTRFEETRPFTIRAATYNKEPDEIFEGMIVVADGTDWNPNAGGGGFYGRYNGTWVKLG